MFKLVIRVSGEMIYEDVGRVWGKYKRWCNIFSFIRVGCWFFYRDEEWE